MHNQASPQTVCGGAVVFGQKKAKGKPVMESKTEKLLRRTVVGGMPVAFWWARPPSRLCVTAQWLVSQSPDRWPASTSPLHWGHIMKPISGQPHFDVGGEHWKPDDAPLISHRPGLLQAELFVATTSPSPTNSTQLTDDEVGVAYAALLPYGMFPEFDPLLPSDFATRTPFRSVGASENFAGTSLGADVGKLVLQRAKYLKYPRVHLFATLPKNGTAPKTWRGFSCWLDGVTSYCQHIPKADGQPKGNQMVLAIPLSEVPDAPELRSW